MAIYIFPYLRKGISNGIVGNSQNAGQTRAELDVNLTVDYHHVDGRTTKGATPKAVTIQLTGPADVKSLSKSAVSHFSPPENAAIRMNSVYMPYLEFYEEDLPWRYTPLPVEKSTNGKEVLLPWMALIAVRKDEVAFRINGSGIRIATLNVEDQQRYSEIFVDRATLLHSAHVQIESAQDFGDVDAVLRENPDCGISRVFCMSKLIPDTEYYALLIPIFESGRLAALGQSTQHVKLDTLAWDAGSNGWTQQAQKPEGWAFPVYFRWKFKTAKSGDFKSLAEKLVFTSTNDYKNLKACLDVDISSSGLQSYESKRPAGVEEVIDVPAALELLNSTVSKRMETKEYRDDLKELLMDNPVFQENATGSYNQNEDPWVVPPIYGARHLLATGLDEKTAGNKLVSQVNLQLPNRIVAGMGSSVVKENQEKFVDRAWRKVEKINEVNQKIREYYQILQANKQAQKKYDFKSLRDKKSRQQVTAKRRALGLDVTYRTLQASGIYKQDVTAEELLKKAGSDPKTSSKKVRRGITPSDIQKIFDKEMWEKRAKEINRQLAIINAYKNCKEFIGPFEDFDYLNDVLELKYDNKIFNFVTQADKESLVAKTGYGVSDADLAGIVTLMLTQPQQLIYTTLKSALAAIPKTSSLEKTDNSKPRLRPLMVELKTPQGSGFFIRERGLIIPEGKKGVAVEYLSEKKDEKNPEKKYLYILSWEDLTNNFSGSIDYWFKTATQSVRVMKGNNGYFVPVQQPSNRINSLKTLSFYYNLLEFKKIFSWNFWFEKTVSDKKRAGYFPLSDGRNLVVDWSKKNNYVDFYLYPAGVKLKANNLKKEYLMPFRFAYNDPEMGFNKFYQSDNYSLWVNFAHLYEAVTDILNQIDTIDNILWEPNFVEITSFGRNASDIETITAQAIATDPTKIEEDDDYGEQEGENLPKQVAEKVKSYESSINNWLGKDLVEVQDNGQSTLKPVADIDPDKLAEERITEIVTTYGYTEDNQVAVNCDSKYPVMAYPDFLDPTFFYLRQLSESYILPSAGTLGKNTITCFMTNLAFEEAFLMGMNTEMGRELLWREYPTDQRGSYFRKFWDQTELPKKADLEKKYYDVKALHQWKSPLGQNHTAGKESMIVFAIKGELMQAYPKTDIYLATSNYFSNPQKQAKERISAEMTSWLSEDTYLVGFKTNLNTLRTKVLAFEQEPGALQYRQIKPEDAKTTSGVLINSDHIKLETPAIYYVDLKQLLKI